MSDMKAFKHTRRILRIPFEWFGIFLGLAVFAFLPRRAMQAVCDFASMFVYLFDSRGKRLARANLAIMFPGGVGEKRARKLIRGHYRNAARTIGHAFWTCCRARARVEAAGEMDARCRAELAAHRPAITVSAHLGCWEILSQLAFLQGHAMMSVAKNIGTGGMTSLLMRARKSIGQEIIPAEGAFRPLMNGLKNGKSLGLLVDQAVRPTDGGVWIRFFGRPVPVSAAPAFFSAKSKAPVLVAWSRPLPDGRYRCEFVAAHDASEARDVWGLTQKVARDLEGVIRRHPSAWLLSYNAFRKTPKPEELAQLEARERKAAAK